MKPWLDLVVVLLLSLFLLSLKVTRWNSGDLQGVQINRVGQWYPLITILNYKKSGIDAVCYYRNASVHVPSAIVLDNGELRIQHERTD